MRSPSCVRLPRPPTNRRDATDDTHVIYGAADDESLGDRLRVTAVANGLSGTRCAQARPPRSPKPRSSKATKGSTRPVLWPKPNYEETA